MTENKLKYRGFTQAQAEAHKRYMEDSVEIKVRMTADKRTIVQEHVANMGEIDMKSYSSREVLQILKVD